MRQGRQETLPRELLLLLLFFGTGRWCLVLSQDSDAATPRKLFGDQCTNDNDCGFEGSVCRWYRGRRSCRCEEAMVTNHLDKCGKAASVNESCFFNEQCEVMTPETECENGICQCRFEKEAIIKPDGKVECRDPDTCEKRRDPKTLYGDRCTTDEDCHYEGGTCRQVCGRGICGCPQGQVTNYMDKCGRAAQVNESCSFNEQCEVITPNTECQSGICRCRFEKRPLTKADGKVECIDTEDTSVSRYPKTQFGDPCISDQDCHFEGSVCKEHNGQKKCQCQPDLVTNHINKCGKAAQVNESCSFNEQCEAMTEDTECKDGICRCRFKKQPLRKPDGKMECVDAKRRRKRRDSKVLFGDPCTVDEDCQFEGAVCTKYIEHKKCECGPDLITNHLDKCGKAVQVNESCFFNEQCEAMTPETECKGDICTCRFEKQPVLRSDGKVECVVIQNVIPSDKFVDPTMIGILVAMFLMFITICVVLRLFSRARWRENRTIFNTPNPRLMNVSLLRENKLLHQERRGSRSSVRGPSRQPSMASLRAHSPNSQGRLFLGSRRGSRGSSNASATSNRSNKSPPQVPPNLSSATTPMLESVTVEVQEPKA